MARTGQPWLAAAPLGRLVGRTVASERSGGAVLARAPTTNALVLTDRRLVVRQRLVLGPVLRRQPHRDAQPGHDLAELWADALEVQVQGHGTTDVGKPAEHHSPELVGR